MLKRQGSIKPTKGFTLIELILVIIILGVMSVGIAGFITLTTQTYLNVSKRDELLANARFVVERLNREIRNAVPNSVRVDNNTIMQCIEFIPVVASTTYIDIPVQPEPARDNITVIEFPNSGGIAPYRCDDCGDLVMVYPLSDSEIYDDHTDATGKVFALASFTPTVLDTWEMTISNGDVNFTEDSPTERMYIANEQISYCVFAGQIFRYNNSIGGSQSLPPQSPVLMAENLAPFDENLLPFEILPATLTRNALVKTRLHFTQDNEDYVFENDIHIVNVP
ncbi:MAG: prepilin-type N-terminal cleavage/methylation domain-containing protein [Colwellia sp.]|nr:prepilin-type N-terminal cleavage/methylation domain-containing protein [Colwellia sp.]MCW8864967.1 prepilin-type N-terminal cleavage/methylation domain-containing protein [Colwellia sp.]MCW9082153.1 prepilin-type N-terminal cleavage/methylation domain-containing protein [Colwellia sp.]